MGKTLLDEGIRRQVRELFAGLNQPVEVLFFGNGAVEENDTCVITQQLLGEVTELSDKLSLRSFDMDQDAEMAAAYKVDAVPGFVMVGKDGDTLTDYGVRFKGVPSGHEFASLVNDLVLVSKRDSGLRPETREYLKTLDKPVHLQVFVTPTWPYCPRAVVLAHQFAMESPLVEAEMVEATEFPELANRYDVSGVPQTTINHGAVNVVGAAPEANLLEQIKQALSQGE